MRSPSKLHFVFAVAAALFACSSATLALDDQEDYIPFVGGAFDGNQLIDKLLVEVRKEVNTRGKDRLSIPDYEKEITKKFGSFEVKGSLKTTNGWLESLSTIERKADANVHFNGTNALIEATLGLKTLKIGMHFDTQLFTFTSEGELTATVRANSISLTGGLENPMSDHCRIVLKSLAVKDLGGIDIQVETSDKAMDGIGSAMATWLTDRFHGVIHKAVETEITAIVEKMVADVKC